MILKVVAGLILIEIGHVAAAAILGLLTGEQDFKTCYFIGGIVLVVGILTTCVIQWCVNILVG